MPIIKRWIFSPTAALKAKIMELYNAGWQMAF
jgi:hypothetical protein